MKLLRSISIHPKRGAERGYMLLYLLFLVALLTISLTIIVPTLKFAIKRDLEQEMVHRGEQYRRAIRRYYRKMGSYPATLDVLENTNDMRFLRKRYKDPINHNKDFKTLTQIDLMKAMGTALSQNAGIAGAQTLGQPIGDPNANSDSSDTNAAATAQIAVQGGTSGASSNPTDPNSIGATQPGAGGVATPGAAGTMPSGTNGYTLPFTSVNGQQGSRVGGGMGGGLVGVASLSGDQTIRIYNKKNHYKDWLFIYDPSQDRGGLLIGPYQPSLQVLGQGLNGQNAGNTNGFGLGIQGMNNGMGPGTYAPGTSTGMGMQH